MTSYGSWICKFESKRPQDLPSQRCGRAREETI